MRCSEIGFEILNVAHVEALLLLPRNRRVRDRFREVFRTYMGAERVIDDEPSDPVVLREAQERSADAKRIVDAIEVLLTVGGCQSELWKYRAALAKGDIGLAEAVEIERHAAGHYLSSLAS